MESTGGVTATRYRPELDGVRAIAIGAVLADHLRLHAVHDGGLGVDVFFALSGYLITSLLVAERRSAGRIDLRAFYIRRMARLYPALLAFLAVAAVIDEVQLHVKVLTVVGASVIAMTYITDLMAFTHNPTWLLYAHTWSLAIEEQFYLVWPAGLIFALRRRLDPRALAVGGAALFLVVGYLAAPSAHHGYAADYFQPQAHAFCLLAGCSLALVKAPPRMRLLVWPALVVLLGLIVFGPKSNDVYLRFVVPAAGLLTCVLIAGLGETRLCRAVLSCYPVRRIGVISYGLYLYHPYVFLVIAAHLKATRAVLVPIQVVAALIVAELSYRFYESPIRSYGRRFHSARAIRTEESETVAA